MAVGRVVTPRYGASAVPMTSSVVAKMSPPLHSPTVPTALVIHDILEATGLSEVAPSTTTVTATAPGNSAGPSPGLPCAKLSPPSLLSCPLSAAAPVKTPTRTKYQEVYEELQAALYPELKPLAVAQVPAFKAPPLPYEILPEYRVDAPAPPLPPGKKPPRRVVRLASLDKLD